MLKNNINHFCKNENKKLVKRSKIITKQTKHIENPNIIDIKLATIKFSKTFHKLSKTIRKTKKVSQAGCAGKDSFSSLNSKTTKTDFFWMNQRL